MKFLKEFFLPIWANLGWFLCVFAAQFRMDYLSIAVPAIAWWVLWHQQNSRAKVILALLALVGCLFDQIIFYLGFVNFNLHSGFVIPVWLFSMWFLFVTMVPTISRFFNGRMFLAAFLGAVMGPLAYKGGEPFGVIALPENAIWIFAIFWGIFFPTCLWVYQTKNNP
jgi:hypothetical protein